MPTPPIAAAHREKVKELAEHWKTSGMEGYTTDELEAFTTASTHPKTFGRLLFPDRPEMFMSVTTRLGLYASYTHKAMKARGAGRITMALNSESAAEAVYKHLPRYAKW